MTKWKGLHSGEGFGGALEAVASPFPPGALHDLETCFPDWNQMGLMWLEVCLQSVPSESFAGQVAGTD